MKTEDVEAEEETLDDIKEMNGGETKSLTTLTTPWMVFSDSVKHNDGKEQLIAM